MFESKINRGRANGYAPLDGSGKVPLDKLPPIQSTIDTGSLVTINQTGSFATTSSLQTLIDVTGSFTTTSSFNLKTGSLATTGSNIFIGNQSISGSINVSSSLVVSSTVVNNGTIDALNSDLIIDGGNLILTGSQYINAGDIVLSGSFAQQVYYVPNGTGSFDVASTDITKLDITKDIHLLDMTDNMNTYTYWFLPDGLYDGQVIRLALKGGSPNYVYVYMNCLRPASEMTIQADASWCPFFDDANGSMRSLATMVYIDGAWNIDTNFWNMY